LKPMIIEVANGRNLEMYHERSEKLTVKKRTCVKDDYYREKELKGNSQQQQQQQSTRYPARNRRRTQFFSVQ